MGRRGAVCRNRGPKNGTGYDDAMKATRLTRVGDYNPTAVGPNVPATA